MTSMQMEISFDDGQDLAEIRLNALVVYNGNKIIMLECLNRRMKRRVICAVCTGIVLPCGECCFGDSKIFFCAANKGFFHVNTDKSIAKSRVRSEYRMREQRRVCALIRYCGRQI
jgi:hypothetical protein